MEIHKALDRLSEIYSHVAKGEVYRGYRSFPVAISALFAVLGGAFQDSIIPARGPTAFVIYWTAIAVLNTLVITSGILFKYLFRSDEFERRMTERVLGQFIPALAAGGILTGIFLLLSPSYVTLLPGLWAIIFSLGLFASRPYLPRSIGWVALFYLLCGSFLLLAAGSGDSLAPWGMATVFGAGQSGAALVLYWKIERNQHG